MMSGRAAVDGLSSPVEVEFDSLGVPTVRGRSRLDVAGATGFLHAQNRFFQMDLLRRGAAGELAALLGPALVRTDRAIRVHRFRALARKVIGSAPPGRRDLIDAYTAGVNAGLSSLGAPPFEYFLLSAEPVPWAPEDSVLVILAMFLSLHDADGSRESTLGVMRDLLPRGLFEFLAPSGSEWDAPLVGDALLPSPVPAPEVFDLRTREPAAAFASPPPGPGHDGELHPGSNNWAVGGALTASGGALLANDMHLGLGVPNIWYRASLEYPAAGWGGAVRVTGVTLPGVPNIIVGSNGQIAWGFTNTEGDWGDLVLIEPDPADPDRYLAPEGSLAFERHEEIIEVRGGDSETLGVDWTIWGPVIDRDHAGRRRALRWTAHEPRTVNFELVSFETARSIEQAQEAGTRAGTPALNLVAADRTGRVGWSIMGAIPRRFGFDGVLDARLPSSWADGTRGWDGWVEPGEYPRIIRPPDGRVWTANNRVVDDRHLELLGDGGYALGARAAQIRDGLLAVERSTPAVMLAIQLDDRAVFLDRWRDLALEALTPERREGNPLYKEFHDHILDWGDRAAVDSVGYRLVRAFRFTLAEQVFGSLTSECKRADERFSYFQVSQYEAPLWELVGRRPIHLLDPKHDSWDDQILAAIDETIATLSPDGDSLAGRTWGERNTILIRHPLSLGVPWLGRWLDMPAEPLPGDAYMPRVQSPGFGPTQRMVVSPGREDEGFFHMPGGQSGHPLSPHYRDGHAAWARGEPTPFLPGAAVSTVILEPALSPS